MYIYLYTYTYYTHTHIHTHLLFHTYLLKSVKSISSQGKVYNGLNVELPMLSPHGATDSIDFLALMGNAHGVLPTREAYLSLCVQNANLVAHPQG